MNILFDHQIFASQRYGGISRYFFEIAYRIASMQGMRATILCPLYVNTYLNGLPPLRVCGTHIVRVPYSSVFMRSLNAALSLLFAHERAAIDIYHETYFSQLNICPKGAARVITIHDMIHEKFRNNFSRFDRAIAAKRAAILRADHIICVSRNTRNDLLTLFDVDPIKTSIVYHGSSLAPAPGTVPCQRKCQLLFVGGRSGYKNFTGFANAFLHSKLRSEGFSVVCFGGGHFSRREINWLARHELDGRFTQTSGDDSALLKLFEESAALVYPSLYEGFGIPPLEAMSCGCPVACSNTASLPEVVGSAAELFDPNDEESIVHAIENIALSSTRGSELSEAGYRRASQFSWKQSAEATASIYRGLGR